MNKKITSLDNKEIKDLIKLSIKSKIRRESGFFVIEGKKELEMAINNGYVIDKIFYNENIVDINQIDFNSNPKIIAVNNDVYSKISFRNSTEGIVGVARDAHNQTDDHRKNLENRRRRPEQTETANGPTNDH